MSKRNAFSIFLYATLLFLMGWAAYLTGVHYWWDVLGLVLLWVGLPVAALWAFAALLSPREVPFGEGRSPAPYGFPLVEGEYEHPAPPTYKEWLENYAKQHGVWFNHPTAQEIWDAAQAAVTWRGCNSGLSEDDM